MNKAARNRKGSGPAVIRFTARFARPSTVKNGALTMLEIPGVVSKKLVGMTKVEGTINGHPFRAALESNRSGGHLLQVNNAMRRGSRADVGDSVNLAILGPEPEPVVPKDLRASFALSKKAQALWKDLTLAGRLDYIRWIESAKTPETRVRRVRRTVEQLAQGKRRPCCVNVYEYMLSRVQE